SERIERFHVPALRIAAVRFALDVVPPHAFLAGRMCPGALARHRAGLAADAPVDVVDRRELSLRPLLLVGKFHRAAQLPVVDIRHLNTPVPEGVSADGALA